MQTARPRIRRRLLALVTSAGLACTSPDVTRPPLPDTPAPLVPVDTAAAVLEWLRLNAAPIARLENSGDDADMVPFGRMVGAARVVGLGEATHGSREFPQLKTRFFRHLVERYGFRAFAIEATMPEGFIVDDFVRNGRGDALSVVKRLYFWSIGGQDFVDMVEWLRSYNQQHPPEKRVGFYGIDIQFPGTAIDSVVSYARRVGGEVMHAAVADRYACAQPYRNDARGAFEAWYGDLPQGAREECNASIAAVHEMLRTSRDALVRGSSAAEYELALRLARVVVQWSVLETYAAARDLKGYDHRDRSMSENLLWALEREGAGARIAVSAHNAHVSVRSPVSPASLATMGHYLKEALGPSGYVTLGFAFDSGSVNARPSPTGGLAALAAPPADSTIDAYERMLRRFGGSYYFDARAAAPGSPTAVWLRGPHRLRQLGALYEEQGWKQYFAPVRLSEYWDLIAFTPRSTPSIILGR